MATPSSSSPLMNGLVESLITSKNPLAILFSIAKIREAIEGVADELLSNIEYSYTEDTAEKFRLLMENYEKTGFYELMYAYYAGTGRLAEQKAYLDKYFEESYWRDPDFYFFVLDKHPQYKIQFALLQDFVKNPESIDTFLKAKEKGGEVLSRMVKKLELPGEDYVKMTSFVAFFEVLVKELHFMRLRGNPFPMMWQKSGRRIARDCYLSMMQDGEKVLFWKQYFVGDNAVSRVLLETLKDKDLFDCFSYLRNGLLKTPRYNIALTETNMYRLLIKETHELKKKSIDEKLAFVGRVHNHMGPSGVRRESFQLVLRKGLMYDNSIDLLDAVLGMSFLSREAYYELKRRTRLDENIENTRFEHLENVTELAEMLESSFLLRLFRPFLIARLARIFNKTSNLYYFIKFLITIHESKSYAEYKMLSRFFFSLETFSKTGFYGKVLLLSEFGWISVLGMLLFFFAPMGVFVAGIILLIMRRARRFFEQKMPELALTANFQIAAITIIFGVASAVGGLTFALKDNTRIAYENFRTLINASTLITSETVSIFSENLKASSLEKEGQGSTYQSEKIQKFNQINYLDNSGYTE